MKMKNRAVALAAAAAALAGCGGGDGNNQAGENGSAPAAEANTAAAATSDRTILDSLTQSQQHATLANAIKAAGLTETLSGPTAYTMLAPTDAAFSQLGGTTANDLLAPEAKGQLVALLTAHIVPGAVTMKDVAAALERGGGSVQMATVGGTTLTFKREGDGILVVSGESRARLTGGEQLQANGVIHSLDGVLTPAG